MGGTYCIDPIAHCITALISHFRIITSSKCGPSLKVLARDPLVISKSNKKKEKRKSSQQIGDVPSGLRWVRVENDPSDVHEAGEQFDQ